MHPDPLFLIIRPAPLRPEKAEWPQWRDTYTKLAEAEGDAYPIVIMPNEADLAATKQRILKEAGLASGS
jgi:hypothetical protein